MPLIQADGVALIPDVTHRVIHRDASKYISTRGAKEKGENDIRDNERDVRQLISPETHPSCLVLGTLFLSNKNT